MTQATPFARAMDAAKKYVVSSTLDQVDWNAELLRGDLEQAVRALKQAPGQGLSMEQPATSPSPAAPRSTP